MNARRQLEHSNERPKSAEDLTVKKDRQCVERALRGDISGFKELVERYERRAFGIALSVLGNPDDAKDVAQEAFLKVYQKLDSFKGESSFYTWLYRIVFNLAVDLSRKRYRTKEIGFVDPDDDRDGLTVDSVTESEHSGKIPGPSEMQFRSELSSKINEALDELTPEHRAVVLLRELDGLSYSEIADSIGISKGTVMSRLHHARKRLQRKLAEFGPQNNGGGKDEDFSGEESLNTLSSTGRSVRDQRTE